MILMDLHLRELFREAIIIFQPLLKIIQYALNQASANGGYLVSINSQEENNYIRDNVIESQQVWIGYYQDTTSNDYSEPNGGWVWHSGENSTYTNWAGGEPNNGSGCSNGIGENNALMYTGGDWNDGCTSNDAKPFILEISINEILYLWSTGDTTETISVSPTETTEYWVDVTTNGVTSRDYITINVINPEITASATEICAGESVDLTVSGAGSIGLPTHLFNDTELFGPFFNEDVLVNFSSPNSTGILKFDLYIHDSWDGSSDNNEDYLMVYLDDTEVFNYSFNNHLGQNNSQTYPTGNLDNTSTEGSLINNLPRLFTNCSTGGNSHRTSLYEIEIPFNQVFSTIKFKSTISGNPPSCGNINDESYSLYNISFNNSSTYIWSTGETTESITVTPTETTEYWVDVTTNGVTCRDYITINVDTEDPTWIFPPSDLTVECDGTGNTTEFNNWLNNTFSGTDNCGSVTITTNSLPV